MSSEEMELDASAIADANSVDNKVAQALQGGESFKVEAGAGSGKTYSLAKAAQWLKDNWDTKPAWRGKKAQCITFTERAADEISKRITKCPFIAASTIHSFAWQTMQQFQRALQNALLELKEANSNVKLLPEDVEASSVLSVQYTQGIEYFEEGTLYLGHDGVLKLFVHLLGKPGFRRRMAQQYCVILIDEYQDTNKGVMDVLMEHFGVKDSPIQLGLFGDAWQTIYTKDICGQVENECLITIKKNVNFRSCVEVVNGLNNLRPDARQRAAHPLFHGSVDVITCNDFIGERRDDKLFNGDLPAEELRKRVDSVRDVCSKKWKDEKNNEKNNEKNDEKILMLTHRALAMQQNYAELLDVITPKGIRDNEDPLLKFCSESVRPIAKLLGEGNTRGIYKVLREKSNSPMIKTRDDKRIWNSLKGKLDSGTVRDVLGAIKETNVIPFPSDVEKSTAR